MIHRAEYDKDYTRVKNGFVQDMSLSLKAKGLMLVILSLPDDWDFSIKGLSYMTNLSEQVVIKLVKELKSAGYITQKKVKNKQGQFVSYEWDVYDLPELNKNRTSAKPNFSKTELRKNRTSEKPNYGKLTPKQITNNNKELNITNDVNKQREAQLKKFTPPTVDEVRTYCQERGNSVDPEAFCDFYTSKGWKVGKNPMKDWKAAVRTWEKRDRRPKPIKTSGNEFTDLLGEEGFTI